jgi:DNA-binding transcriptional LysR family regulator
MSRNTLDGLEALAALAQFGTVSEAATRLRLTQSAVSKRLQALQRAVNFQIVEAHGRRLALTADAVSLLERGRGVMAELQALTAPPATATSSVFSLAIADSIAASWGPGVIAAALRQVSDVKVNLHAHRSVLLIENVRLGRYHIGLTTDTPAAKDLVHFPVITEPMVLVYAGLGRKPRPGAPLITIEPSSMTWRAIGPLVKAHHPQLLARDVVPVESFSAALQMVKAGFGDGLAPLGLALEMKIGAAARRLLPHVERQVTLVTRKTVNQMHTFARLRLAIAEAAARHFARSGAARART